MPTPYRLKAKPPSDDERVERRRTPLGPVRRTITADTADIGKRLPKALVIPVVLFVFFTIQSNAAVGVAAFIAAIAFQLLNQSSFWGAIFRRIDLHTGGLAYRRLGSRVTVPFDDVDEVWLDVALLPVPTWIVQGLTLKEHNGKAHSINLYGVTEKDWQFLLKTVLAKCSEDLLPDAQEALAAGETLRFGPVSIDNAGIEVTTVSFGTSRSQKMPWSEMTRAEMVQGQFQFFSASQHPIVVRVRSVPHPTVLLALLRSLAPWRQ